jgi:DNA polymerase
MPILFRDIETRSTVELKAVGSHVYAAHCTTGVWCAGYAVDDGPVEIWIPDQPIPECFVEAARNPDWLIVAHNDAFERVIEEYILHPQFGWPLVPLERHRCTMAMTLAAALPAALEKAVDALNLPYAKDKVGQALMRKMAKPAPGGGWIEDADLLRQLYAYCRQDVEAERALFRALPPLTEDEQRLWQLDAVINARGFHTDGTLLDAARRVVAKAEAELQAEFREITGLDSSNQTAKLTGWLAGHGCTVTDVQKGTLRHALRRKELAPEARRAIQLRLELAHASAGKVAALKAWLGADGRVRGTLQYHGAATGRWVGRGPQPQNMRRDGADIEAKITAVLNGGAGLESPIEAVGDIGRAMITAAPGHRLLIGDFSGIESRGLAWISGQESKLRAWVRFDETGDPNDDPYVLIGRALGHPEKTARDFGKIADLAFGYQGGVGAWNNMAPEDDASSEATIVRYRDGWRAQHPATVRFWYALDRAAIIAISYPGVDHRVGRLVFRYDPPFLRVQLPQGRSLSYPFPRIEADRFGHAQVIFLDNAGGKFTDCRFGNGAYGGLWAENVVSGIARDLLAAALTRLEAAGYPVVLHVHDEVVCEAPYGFGTVEEFKRILTEVPPWAEGLPIAAKVRNGPRFSKSNPAPVEPPVELKPEAPWDDDVSDLYADLDIPEFLRRDKSEPAPAPAWDDDPIAEILAAAAKITLIEGALAITTSAPSVTIVCIGGGNGGGGPTYNNKSKTDNQCDADGYPHGERDTGHQTVFFIYCRADGQPYLGVKKTSTKQFPQYHVENGQWVKGAPKGLKIPYRLPELIRAPLDAWVVIAAGEKDADTAAGLGFAGTTNPEGERKGAWVPALNAWFYGRRVAIMEDHDATGAAHVIEVAEALRGTASDIRIVTFHDLPAHGDLTDWVQAEPGRGYKELLAKIEATTPVDDAALESVRASTVKRKAIRWLWRDRFAVGKLGILAGLPDEGKSLILNYIASRLTRPELAWPNGEGRAQTGNVVLLTAEDDPEDTVTPRLDAVGADSDHIEIVQMVADRDKDGRQRARMFSLAGDLALLRQKIDEVGKVVAILIDPITAYLGTTKTVDAFRDSDVRAVLTPLVHLARERQIAVIVVMHFNKKVDITNALLRISNSLAFGGVARHVFTVTDDPENGRKLMARAKNNLAAKDENKTLAFHFDARTIGTDPDSGEIIRAPFVVFEEGYVDVTATEALSAVNENKSPAARDTAKSFLEDMLSNGPIAAADIEEAAEANGIAKRTLYRAKAELKIRAVKDGPVKDGQRTWRWHPAPQKGQD